jgi:hypothetical protein
MHCSTVISISQYQQMMYLNLIMDTVMKKYMFGNKMFPFALGNWYLSSLLQDTDKYILTEYFYWS